MIKQPTTREEAKDWASDLFKSGFCHDCENQEQVLYKILYGMELGVGVMASINGIYIQENKKKDKNGNITGVVRKPTLTAPMMSTVIQKSGVFELRTKTFSNELSEIEIRKSGETIRVSSFSKQDAAVAGLLAGANSYNYQKYSRNMFHHRNISNIAKTDCAECFGGQPVYTPEEIGMSVDEDGIPQRDETAGDFTCDMRTYVNEELAAKGMPSVEESKAKDKASKAAVRHDKAVAKAAATVEQLNPEPVEPDEEPAAPKSEFPTQNATSADSPSTNSTSVQSAASGKVIPINGDQRPGREHVAQLIQTALDSGLKKESASAILQDYLFEKGVVQNEDEAKNFVAHWTMTDFNNIIDIIKQSAPAKAA